MPKSIDFFFKNNYNTSAAKEKKLLKCQNIL